MIPMSNAFKSRGLIRHVNILLNRKELVLILADRELPYINFIVCNIIWETKNPENEVWVSKGGHLRDI